MNVNKRFIIPPKFCNLSYFTILNFQSIYDRISAVNIDSIYIYLTFLVNLPTSFL